MYIFSNSETLQTPTTTAHNTIKNKLILIVEINLVFSVLVVISEFNGIFKLIIVINIPINAINGEYDAKFLINTSPISKSSIPKSDISTILNISENI